MIGGRAGESQHLATSDSPQSPQMISMLLRSCDIQLSDTCQQELNSKLGATALGMAKGEEGIHSFPALCLLVRLRIRWTNCFICFTVYLFVLKVPYYTTMCECD